jgi:hypothetical protein
MYNLKVNLDFNATQTVIPQPDPLSLSTLAGQVGESKQAVIPQLACRTVALCGGSRVF